MCRLPSLGSRFAFRSLFEGCEGRFILGDAFRIFRGRWHILREQPQQGIPSDCRDHHNVTIAVYLECFSTVEYRQRNTVPKSTAWNPEMNGRQRKQPKTSPIFCAIVKSDLVFLYLLICCQDVWRWRWNSSRCPSRGRMSGDQICRGIRYHHDHVRFLLRVHCRQVWTFHRDRCILVPRPTMSPKPLNLPPPPLQEL